MKKRIGKDATTCSKEKSDNDRFIQSNRMLKWIYRLMLNCSTLFFKGKEGESQLNLHWKEFTCIYVNKKLFYIAIVYL